MTSRAGPPRQVSESALLIRGRKWICKIGPGGKRDPLAPETCLGTQFKDQTGKIISRTGSAGNDDNACLFGKAWAQEVEKQGVSDMIYCKSGLDLVLGIVKIEDLQTSIENKDFDWWIAFFCLVCDEGTNFGQTG